MLKLNDLERGMISVSYSIRLTDATDKNQTE